MMVFLNILGLPGLSLMVAVHGANALTKGWDVYVVALLAEAVELRAAVMSLPARDVVARFPQPDLGALTRSSPSLPCAA